MSVPVNSSRLISLLAAVGSLAAIGFICPKPAFAQKRRPPNVILVSPKAGDVLTPGDQITIAWEIDAPANANFQGCEQEIYLSTDKGKSIAARLTPEFSYTMTSYTLTVPNLPTKKAVIVIGFGCEGATPYFEVQYPQKQSVFRISPPPAGLEEVRLMSAGPVTGETGQVVLSWKSSVRNLDHFEVQMSADRGARFQTIGLTSDKTYLWHIPEGVSGEASFRVIAHRTDGTSLESLVGPELKLE
jgi:hypothetical protein